MTTMRYILGSTFAVTSSITILILGMALLYVLKINYHIKIINIILKNRHTR